MQHLLVNILLKHTPPKHFFLLIVVMLHIKSYNNMQAKNMPLHSHLAPEIGSKSPNIFVYFFQNVVMMHIKLKGIKHFTLTHTVTSGLGLNG